MAFSTIRPYHYVAIRVTNDFVYIEQLKPNSLINLGKYGSFHTNQILGRPYYLTFDILDKAEAEQQDGRELRVVCAAELHATALLEEGDDGISGTPAEWEDSHVLDSEKSNRDIVDDPTNQKLTMAEIEALKQDQSASTKELIAKIMSSHAALDQKTAFSLAKYTLRKHRKYTKRFTVLPLDVAMLTDWFMIQRDFSKIMEVRNETMGLIGCWGNVHHAGNLAELDPCGRYLVVDDTGGLIVAAMAERMGILHPTNLGHALASETSVEDEDEAPTQASRTQHKGNLHMSATSNTITLIHANQQPNLSILRYFNYDYNTPTPSHPLYAHLCTLSWLQLLEPASDSACQEPEVIGAETLSALKSNRRSTYFRKRRRWERVTMIGEDTRAGGFDGLVVASYTNPLSILRHTVPLLSGGAQVVVYSRHIEPLAELTDAYSTARRTAFLNTPEETRLDLVGRPGSDFPVDPTLLLVPTVQTSRARRWQVLPGRTHPLMTSRGGTEGYVFVAARVIPAKGRVEARGRPGRKKKPQNTDECAAKAGEPEAKSTTGAEHSVETNTDVDTTTSRKRKHEADKVEEPPADALHKSTILDIEM
ncbi:hypothetical protein DV736_g2726, partial [Chaetothyriales sp. CBS 134916]